jgi:hypothetical protein
VACENRGVGMTIMLPQKLGGVVDTIIGGVWH